MKKKLIRVANRLEIVPINHSKKGVINLNEFADMFFIQHLSASEIALKLKSSYYAVNNAITKIIVIGQMDRFRIDTNEIATRKESYKDLFVQDVEENPKIKDLIGMI